MLNIQLTLSSVAGVVFRQQGLKNLAGDTKFDVCWHL
jgi:hypothetical protein